MKIEAIKHEDGLWLPTDCTETIQSILSQERIPEVADNEQPELEALFGKCPQPEQFVTERHIEL